MTHKIIEGALPIFDIIVWPYKDKIVGHCVCNRCGEHFSLTLHCSPVVLEDCLRNEPFIKKRLITTANAKHFCDEDSLKQDVAETNRIVNKWHEYKVKNAKAKVFGDKK
jgi:hypothetical protein